jgi:hypothetical protein
MKRVWFAVVFIALCAGLCIYQQSYVKQCCGELASMLQQAQKYEENGEDSELKEQISRIQKYWIKHNDFLFIFSEHETLDDLAYNIRSLDKAHNMKSALAETRTLVIVFYENERITPANIF